MLREVRQLRLLTCSGCPFSASLCRSKFLISPQVRNTLFGPTSPRRRLVLLISRLSFRSSKSFQFVTYFKGFFCLFVLDQRPQIVSSCICSELSSRVVFLVATWERWNARFIEPEILGQPGRAAGIVIQFWELRLFQTVWKFGRGDDRSASCFLFFFNKQMNGKQSSNRDVSRRDCVSFDLIKRKLFVFRLSFYWIRVRKLYLFVDSFFFVILFEYALFCEILIVFGECLPTTRHIGAAEEVRTYRNMVPWNKLWLLSPRVITDIATEHPLFSGWWA